MGFNNPDVPWKELERTLSDRARDGRTNRVPQGANGGDSPAWSPVRSAYEAPAGLLRRVNATPYAELHCHSTFSFLDGASHPEELAEEAVRLGLEALAITDHDGFYGVVRFAEAARAVGLPTVFGAELSLGLTKPQNGVPDPEGAHLLVLARDPEGYARLASTISAAQLAGVEKGKPDYSGIAWDAAHGDHWLVLTGCRKGTVPAALERHGPAAATAELDVLVATFGRPNVAVELCDHGDPLDSHRNDALARLAVHAGVDVVATTNAHYATPARRPLATAMAAVRARRSMDDLDGWLPACAGAHLRSGDEQARRFARWPGAVERAAELGRACAFDLHLVAPQLPPFACPDGLSEMAYLRRLTSQGAVRRYGIELPLHPQLIRQAAQPPGGAAPPMTPGSAKPGARRAPSSPEGAAAQLEHELSLIEQLGFPGYFLVVWDIVDFCRRSNIYCQGRGSAANSAVCYALGITNADAVALGLLFERFLSPERDGPPDIDIDIESGRREEVIQYVYAKHGRRHAAQVANVITYRAKSSIRDVAKALGYAAGQQDAWSKQADAWGGVAVTAQQQDEERQAAQPPGGAAPPKPPGSAKPGAPQRGDQIPADVLALAAELEHAPRHLGIHSGGMVICDRPIVEVCPVEWARMTGSTSKGKAMRGSEPIRTVLQWDKDDCAAVGLVKFDLLGLGMLEVLHGCIDRVREVHGDVAVDLATLPQEDEVYDMLGRADSIGVFQVESRAQMATLPRLRPREFYDLVVEVALIRPGPIQGGSVHPYIRRRNGQEDVTYLHPLLEKSLAKTLGVPLFQEQLMQMAIDVGGFSPGEADMLRQAMGSKRSRERMERLHQRFADGAAERGVGADVIEMIWEKLAAFASYGFPESHSVSFAYLVYASSWLKRWYPAAFCAALLDAQPMGFYAPHTLVQDARRHGVEVRTPDLNRSAALSGLEGALRAPGSADPDVVGGAAPPGGFAASRPWGKAARDALPEDWGKGGPAVRLGISAVRGIGAGLAEEIAAGRPYATPEDLAGRVSLTLPQLEVLATSGAFDCFGMSRREAIWAAGAVAQMGTDRHGVQRLPGIVTGVTAPGLPAMTGDESSRADLWSTGVSPEGHPTVFVREHLAARGVVTATDLAAVEPGARVLVGGVVTHRQRPATAGGTLFVNLEDETGLINVVVSKGCWAAHRRVARTAPAMLVRGRLERSEGVTNVIADRLEALPLSAPTKSRDFR